MWFNTSVNKAAYHPDSLCVSKVLYITHTQTQMQTHLKHSVSFLSSLTDVHVSADLLGLFLSHDMQTNGADCSCLQWYSMNIQYPNLRQWEWENYEYLWAAWSVSIFWGLHPAAIFLDNLFLGLTYFWDPRKLKRLSYSAAEVKEAVRKKLENGFDGQTAVK